VLAIGLIMGYQLLVRLVPQLWESILPGGLDQGSRLQGLPGVIWQLAWFCHTRFPVVFVAAVVVVGVSFLMSRRPLLRPFAWLMAVSIIAIDAGILAIAMKAGMDANGVGQLMG
jgi:hypothetical protein